MKKIIILTCSSIILFTAGCGPSSEELTFTIAAQTEQSSAMTLAAMPTDTPTATPTPVPPTSTQTSTFTPVPPTPTLISHAGLTEYFENARILRVITFDNSNDWVGRVENGVSEVIGVDRAGLKSGTTLREGYGILVNFKYTIGTEFQIYFYRSGSRKSFGMYMYSNETYIIHTQDGIDLLNGEGRNITHLHRNLALIPDRWYSLIMAIGRDGELFLFVWDPANPDNILRGKQNSKWVKRQLNYPWQLKIDGYNGTITFDDFVELEFDDILYP